MVNNYINHSSVSNKIDLKSWAQTIFVLMSWIGRKNLFMKPKYQGVCQWLNLKNNSDSVSQFLTHKLIYSVFKLVHKPLAWMHVLICSHSSCSKYYLLVLFEQFQYHIHISLTTMNHCHERIQNLIESEKEYIRKCLKRSHRFW